MRVTKGRVLLPGGSPVWWCAETAPAPGRRDGRHDVKERQVQDSLPVRVRSGEMPGSPVVMPPCVVERPGAERGVSDRPVCNVSEA